MQKGKLKMKNTCVKTNLLQNINGKQISLRNRVSFWQIPYKTCSQGRLYRGMKPWCDCLWGKLLNLKRNKIHIVKELERYHRHSTQSYFPGHTRSETGFHSLPKTMNTRLTRSKNTLFICRKHMSKVLYNLSGL